MNRHKMLGLGLVALCLGGLNTAQAQNYSYSPVSVYRGAASEVTPAASVPVEYGPAEAPIRAATLERLVSDQGISVPVTTAIYRTQTTAGPATSADVVEGQVANGNLSVEPVRFRRYYGYGYGYRPYGYGYRAYSYRPAYYGYRPYYYGYGASYYRPRLYRPYGYGGYGYGGYGYSSYYGGSYGFGVSYPSYSYGYYGGCGW